MNQDSKEEERFQPTRRQERAARKHASWKDRSKYKKTDLSKRESLLKIEADKKLSKKSTLLKGRVLSILPEEITVEVEHIR